MRGNKGGQKGRSGVYKRSPETLVNMKLAAKKRYIDNGPTNFKGDDVCYNAFHLWVQKCYGKPKMCEHCLRTDKKKYEWALKNHSVISRNRQDYLRLCTSCHRIYDIEFNHYKCGFKKKTE